MNFSEEWKSLWSISSVYSPPLLLHGQSATPLGPLFFSPSPNTQTLLFSSPFLSSPLPPFDSPPPLFTNTLQILKSPTDPKDFLLFFPHSLTLDRVGFVKLSVKGPRPEIPFHRAVQVFEANQRFNCRICRISVNSVASSSSISGNSVYFGYLFACTLYAIHCYRVEISNPGSDLEEPILAYLGSKQFNHLVVHACWNPHLQEECLVLLENGNLYLFDLWGRLGTEKFPKKLKGTRIKLSWEDIDSGGDKGEWLSGDFSWHPRIFIICCSYAVFLVDWRCEESNVSILAKIEMFGLTQSVGNRFIAFCKAGSGGFYYTVASENHLFLLDTRNPSMPLLQWAHGLDNPCYINVFELLKLRSTIGEDKYKWPSDSGFAILLGSFLSSEFNLFCYGPPLPVPYGSVASKVIDLCNSFYAWELPSELSLLGNNCHCGDCLLREILTNDDSSNERVLGFCILSEDILDPLRKSNGCGFTLIRLVSSGKLESQNYHASWDFHDRKMDVSMEECSSRVEDSLPCLNLRVNPIKTKSYTQDRYKLICDMLKAVRVNNIDSPPLVADVISDLSWPMSIHEVTSSMMWAGLTVDLLQLAFTISSEVLGGALVDHRKIVVDFTDVPIVPQMPPFLQKKPLNRSNQLSSKLQLGDGLVGPLLPLSFLLTLREVGVENCAVSEDEANRFSVKKELIHQCNETMRVAKNMASSEACPSLNECAVFLAEDREEKTVGSQGPKSLFFYKPSAISGRNNPNSDSLKKKLVYEDEKFDTFISRRRHGKEFTANLMKEPVGIEVFNELCPIELNFDLPPMKFGSKELKGYRQLYKQFSKWQKDSKQYQNFCTSTKIQK